MGNGGERRRPDRKNRARALALAILIAACGACADTTSRRAHPAERNGDPSPAASIVLRRLDLVELFARRPDAVLDALHTGLADRGDEARLYALAELSLRRGEETGDRARQLAAAAYAYAFLFPGADGRPPDSFDPRLLAAREIYNRGLRAGLEDSDGEMRWDARRTELPFGTLSMERNAAPLELGSRVLESLRPAEERDIEQVRNRYRQPGIGMALLGTTASRAGGTEPATAADPVPVGLHVPVTAVLRFEHPRAGLVRGDLRARLDLIPESDARRIRIDGRDVPLEIETSTPLAFGVDALGIGGFERASFRADGLAALRAGGAPARLFSLRTHRPGRIPLVLVYGSASGPQRWAEVANEIGQDPELRELFEIWIFVYHTVNPVPLSAALLRDALTRQVAALDPEGKDPALRRMVVIGRSQGGLLAKLTAIESGTRFWDDVSDVPIDALTLDRGTREVLLHSLFYRPLPFVERIVYIATPHRGIYLADVNIAGFRPAVFASRLLQLPIALVRGTRDLVSHNQNGALLRRLDRNAMSLDNMVPGERFASRLASIPVDPRVTTHSIIAVTDDSPLERASDGVVAYESAHVDGVASERIVRGRHTALESPEAVAEVLRILRAHLR